MSQKLAIQILSPEGARIRCKPEAARASDTAAWVALLERSLSAPLPVFCGALASWSAPLLLLPRHDPSDTFSVLARLPLQGSVSVLAILACAVVYLTLSGFLLVSATQCLARACPTWARILIPALVAPAFVISATAMAVASFTFFFSAIVWCFPALL